MKKDSEIFLVDSNTFMTPYRFYYAFDLVPAYWDMITPYIKSEQIVLLDMVRDEIGKGKDDLAEWIDSIESIKVIPHVNGEIIAKYSEVIRYVQTCGLYKESAVNIWAGNGIADPWLIAAAAANGYTLVTEEVGSGGLSTKNPNKSAKIPDVAAGIGLETINGYEMMRRLNIRIN